MTDLQAKQTPMHWSEGMVAAILQHFIICLDSHAPLGIVLSRQTTCATSTYRLVTTSWQDGNADFTILQMLAKPSHSWKLCPQTQ